MSVADDQESGIYIARWKYSGEFEQYLCPDSTDHKDLSEREYMLEICQ